MTGHHPEADRVVRPARASDAASMAAVQLRAWRHGCAGLLPRDLLDALEPADVAAQWGAAVAAPPTARHQVLVALDGAALVGFATTQPASDADCDPQGDAEMGILVVDPGHTGAGHGSRLLAAVSDTSRAAAVRRLLTWVLAGDTTLQNFLEGAGWARDGARRDLEVTAADAAEGSQYCAQVRLHTALDEPR